MSIIERAASRLDKDRGLTTPSPLPLPPSQDTVSAAPIPQTTDRIDEPAAPAPQRSASKKIEINLAKLSELGFITAGGGRSPVAEYFRIIKRPLIKRAFSQKGDSTNPRNLIMVTSSLPGEGKTFCSINLAMSIAMELDHTVLLVDADVSRPSVLRTLGVEADRGLMDILLDDKLDLADVMLKTNVDTLSILPAGISHRNSTELLASQTMSILLEEIASRYPDRIVIFDSPPLLLTSEAQVLASKMGQIVVVVEAETTTQRAVKASLQQLEGCSNVNLVYNKSRVFPGLENYGYRKYY